jgi:hypothetical protein
VNGEGPEELLDPETPAEVDIRLEARAPVEDPTVGVPVEVTASGSPDTVS